MDSEYSKPSLYPKGSPFAVGLTANKNKIEKTAFTTPMKPITLNKLWGYFPLLGGTHPFPLLGGVRGGLLFPKIPKLCTS